MSGKTRVKLNLKLKVADEEESVEDKDGGGSSGGGGGGGGDSGTREPVDVPLIIPLEFDLHTDDNGEKKVICMQKQRLLIWT